MFPAAVWLIFSSMLCSLRLSGGGSFPKPLSPEEEKRCLALAAQGDLEARNTLIERNLRLVAHIMKKYYTQSADQEDLISIGTIGLIKGISTFDPSKWARLATYAARCVENAILSQGRLWAQKQPPGKAGGRAGGCVHRSRRTISSCTARRTAVCGMRRFASKASPAVCTGAAAPRSSCRRRRRISSAN